MASAASAAAAGSHWGNARRTCVSGREGRLDFRFATSPLFHDHAYTPITAFASIVKSLFSLPLPRPAALYCSRQNPSHQKSENLSAYGYNHLPVYLPHLSLSSVLT